MKSTSYATYVEYTSCSTGTLRTSSVMPHLQQLLVLLELLPQVWLNQLLQLRSIRSVHSLLGHLATLATGIQDDTCTGTVEDAAETITCQGDSQDNRSSRVTTLYTFAPLCRTDGRSH
jgi:hypothetical protein